MREVDWLFAKMGMQTAEDDGREIVICDEVPKCQICLAHPFCTFGQSRYQKPTGTITKNYKKGKSRRIRPERARQMSIAHENAPDPFGSEGVIS